MVSFKRQHWIGGSLLLPLVFSTTLMADAPVVDLTAKPVASAAAASQPMSVEQRLQLLERKVSSDALIEIYQRLDGMQMELQQLRGMVEEQAHAVEGMKQRQRSLYLDLDQRISSLQQSVKQLQSAPPAQPIAAVVPPSGAVGQAQIGDGASLSPPVTGAGVSVAPPAMTIAEPAQGGVNDGAGATETPPAASVGSPAEPMSPLQEQGEYQQALDLLMAESYDSAIEAFVGFLQRYPKGEYRMNAQYWLAEAYYATRRFDLAIESFAQVVGDKAARKRPDAMLKSGYSFYEQKRWGECRDILEQLIAEYPQSATAGLAEQRLQMLRAANL